MALDGPPRGQFEFNGRLFAVGQANFYEVIPTFATNGQFISATVNALNGALPLANDFLPASMAANETQLLIASGGSVYIYYLAAMVDSVTGLPVAKGTFQQVAASNFTLSTGNAPVKQVVFCDSFFLALIANSQTIGISNVLDGNNWNLNGQIVVSVYPDNVVGLLVDHREVWVFGRKSAVVYFASGSLSVFDVAPGGFVEQGSGATFATSRLDNSMFWVGGDDRGNAVGWRATGYNASRITTHPVEFAWQKYPKVSDAVSYAYQDSGHTFWVIYFPSANNALGATWVYDTATGLWHERDFLNEITGQSLAHPSWNHAFAFGQHIVGDWNTPNLYWMSLNFLDNDGVPIIRLRTAPHIFTEEERIEHTRFELDMDLGVGATGAANFFVLQDSSGKFWKLTVTDAGLLQTSPTVAVGGNPLILTDPTLAATWIVGITTAGLLTTTSTTLNLTKPTSFLMAGPSSAWSLSVTAIGLFQTTVLAGGIPAGANPFIPLIFLDWSNDGGKTWSNKQGRSFGALGDTRIPRPVWRRLGQARVRTYRITCSEAVPVRIFDAYVNANPGFQPTERIVHQYRKSA